MLTAHNFTYGLLTPALGYVMSCLGAFLGLRCTSRAMALEGRMRLRWLLLAALSIGTTGIWVMHFIAMLGYSIPGEQIQYNVPLTIASMLIAVVVVGIGLLIVGFAKPSWRNLLLAGIFTGFGVASMHYTGMAAMRMYRASGSAGMVMGTAGGATAESFLFPLILGISIVAFMLTATIVLSPNEDEIRSDAELMARIEQLRSDARLVTTPRYGFSPHAPVRALWAAR
jgi:NO-binding membrane sensor protein with MHYT domain